MPKSAGGGARTIFVRLMACPAIRQTATGGSPRRSKWLSVVLSADGRSRTFCRRCALGASLRGLTKNGVHIVAARRGEHDEVSDLCLHAGF